MIISVSNGLEFRFYKTKCVATSLVYDIDFVCLCIAEYEEIMSEKFHLYTCVLGIHGLDAKALGADDADLVLILVSTAVNEIISEDAAGLLMSGNELVTILFELTLDNLLYKVYGNIHVVADLLRSDDTALNRDGNLDLLSFLFNGKSNISNLVVVEILLELGKLFLYCIFEAVCKLDIASCDSNSHTSSPYL